MTGAANDNGPLAPRLLSKAEAAAYCGFKLTAFSDHVRAGKLPPSLPGLKKWDRKALDQFLDEASGLAKPDAANDNVDPWAEWKKQNAS